MLIISNKFIYLFIIITKAGFEHMKYVVLFLCLYIYIIQSVAANNTIYTSIELKPETNTTHWYTPIRNRLYAIWYEGKTELYFPTYAWHNRYTYSQKKIDSFNENPWGGGLGKSYYDPDGDWHALYAFAFLDSHKNLEPVVGYAFLKILHFNEQASIGGGFAALVTARPDIWHNIPFPGALPWFGINYKRVSLSGTYIPGAQGAGNVLFLLTKVVID